ncbi:MAG: hypothetical protein HY000_00070 [Planctomycetes bacterium]|nr:hypothetical protein [Planctomycetota bacterium]
MTEAPHLQTYVKVPEHPRLEAYDQLADPRFLWRYLKECARIAGDQATELQSQGMLLREHECILTAAAARLEALAHLDLEVEDLRSSEEAAS